jgi:hypothetical protein
VENFSRYKGDMMENFLSINTVSHMKLRNYLSALLLIAFAFSFRGPDSVCVAVEPSQVTVTFELPNGDSHQTTITDDEVRVLLQKNFGYMVEWWVHGALAKLGLSYEEEVVDAKTKAIAIVKIEEVANTVGAKWTLYVNGHRSKYHINTQTREGVKTIRLVYEKTQE